MSPTGEMGDAKRRREEAREAKRKWVAHHQNIPFLDNKLMDDTPPDCSAESFIYPKLRRSPFTFDSIDWDRSVSVGGGMDGWVWKVWFGEDGPFALKLFWSQKPFQDWTNPSIQRECQNVALLQMIATALQRAKEESTPIMGFLDPQNYHEARHNLDSFSDKWRRQDKSARHPEEVETVSTMPRIAKCHGWLSFKPSEYQERVPDWKKARPLRIDKEDRYLNPDVEEYVGIVYEWIEKGPNDLDDMVATCRFFNLAGFSWGDGYIMMRNWHQGILIDHADIAHPRAMGFEHLDYALKRDRDWILQSMAIQPNEC